MNENNIYNAEIDQDTIDLLLTAFELYNISKSHKNVYKNEHDVSICKTLIDQYYRKIRPNYVDMILNFKRKYIANEALVEKNDTPEERKGVALAYDYITSFDIDKDYFNIFVNSLHIHSLLYKPLDEKKRKEVEDQRSEAERLYEEAKKERNLKKLREAREMARVTEGVSFGGSLRKGPVIMRDFNIEVPSAAEACRIFNGYLQPDKVREYEEAKADPNIFHYIDYCVRTVADLIALQPFGDGNKRTFRTLLNLMFKERNLPPVYIVKKERKAYHDALEKAVCDKDYSSLTVFYYFKICDSIYELDFEPYLKHVDAIVPQSIPSQK